MAAYRSSTTGFVNGTGGAGAALVLNKPANLAVDDYMLAFVVAQNTNSNDPSPTTPTGWTLLDSQAGSSGGHRYYLYGKKADAGDVAAASFTWNFAVVSGTTNVVGELVAVQSINTTTPINIENSVIITVGGTSNLSGAAITPSAESVLFMFLGTHISTSFSAEAIANHNPGWTEEIDYAQTLSAGAITVAMAHGAYPFTTTTGAASATLANTTTDKALFLVAMNAAPAIVATPLTMTMDMPRPSIPVIARAALSMTMAIVSPVVSAIAQKYFNQARHDSDWINEERN